MKIAEITTYKEGGVYTHVIELVKRFNSETIIVTGNTKKSGFERENSYLYYHIPKVKSVWDIFFINPPGSYKKLEKLFLEENVEIVHFHNPLFTFLYGFIKKKKFPTVMTAHYVIDIKANKLVSETYRRFIKITTKYIGERIDKIICVNRDYVSTFESWGVDAKKLIYIPNGVDTDRFSPGKSNIRENYRNDKIILYFGRLHYQKNVELLVESFRLVKEKMRNVKLIIIGTGNLYEKLKRMTSEDKDIIMTGFIPDDLLIDYLRAADVVVFPSRGETASFTLMEAMACELPVVSSDVGNARELLQEDRGIILKEYTKEEIADICIKILNDESLAKYIGKRARKYVVENYDWNKISKKTEDIFIELIDES